MLISITAILGALAAGVMRHNVVAARQLADFKVPWVRVRI